MSHYNIALDGPSASGKSTIARILSERLGILYLDTGALYRAVGLKAYENGWDCEDSKVIDLLLTTEITVTYNRAENKQTVLLDGRDVSSEIRRHIVSDYGSKFSALPSVRAKLLNIQRDIAAEYNSILDGRDIGTCVLPNAKYKFFMTASSEARAHRRYNELTAKGETGIDLCQIKADIEARDYRDSHREIAPLRQADDAMLIDTTNLNISEVAEKILSYINE